MIFNPVKASFLDKLRQVVWQWSVRKLQRNSGHRRSVPQSWREAGILSTMRHSCLPSRSVWQGPEGKTTFEPWARSTCQASCCRLRWRRTSRSSSGQKPFYSTCRDALGLGTTVHPSCSAMPMASRTNVSCSKQAWTCSRRFHCKTILFGCLRLHWQVNTQRCSAQKCQGNAARVAVVFLYGNN